MAKTAAIATSKNAGVWIDHRKAKIVGPNPEGKITRVILSNVEKHPARGGDSPMKGSFESQQVPADDRRQRALTGELNVYYDAVIEAVRSYDRVFLFGPGEAKGELHSRLLKRKLGGCVAAIETADQMTDRQIVAKVCTYFATAATRS